MVSRFFAILALCLSIAACSTVQQATAYRCEDSDFARHRLIFHPNGRFAVQLVKLNDRGDVTSRALHAGNYRKRFALYDLGFDELSPSQIKRLFAGTLGIFVGDGTIYRIENLTPNLFIGRCRMKREI
jgi:hypothetical protein